MIRIAARMGRLGLLVITLAGVLDAVIQAVGYEKSAGTTLAAREAFAQQMNAVAGAVTWIAPLPIHLETMGGWLRWKEYTVVVPLLAFWAVIAASGALRGDEDSGLVEQWLSTGIGRLRYMVTRFVVFAVAAVVSVVFIQAATMAAAAGVGLPVDGAGMAEFGLTLVAFTLCCYGVTALLAQVAPSRSSAAGAAGGVLVAMFFINSISRTAASLQPLARVLSPFYYVDTTTSIVPGGSFDLAGTAGLLVVAVVLVALVAWLMTMRDVGGVLVALRPHTGRFVDTPSENPLLRIPVLSVLYEHRLGLAGWAVGALVGAAAVASFGHSMVDNLVKGANAYAHGYLAEIGHGDPYVGVTGLFWFSIFLMLLAVYAITQVSSWTADDQEGRLETLLSAPVSRSRVVLERAVTFLVACAVVVGISSVAFYFVAHANGIDVHVGNLWDASWPLLAFALSFAAVGAVLATRVPRLAAGMLGVLAFLSYVITLGAPLMKWPDWTLKLSLFSLYGNPISTGVYWDGFWILAAITVAGFAIGSVLMNQREVGA